MQKRAQFCKVKGFTLIELLVVIMIIAILAAILFPVFIKARDTGRKAVCISNLKQIGIAIGLYKEDHNGYPAQYWAGPTAPVPDPLWNEWGYGKWMYMLKPYVKDESLKVYVCPSYRKRPYMEGSASAIPNASYGMNEYIFHIFPGTPPQQYYMVRTIKYPVDTALVADCNVNLLFNDWGLYLPGDDYETNPAYGDGIQLPRGMMRIKYANGNMGGKLRARHDGTDILYCDLHAQFMPLRRFESLPRGSGYSNPHTSQQERPLIFPDAIPIP